jgi:hypothetical protein
VAPTATLPAKRFGYDGGSAKPIGAVLKDTAPGGALFGPPRMRREASRVSFLMCPFCVRVPSSVLATSLSERRSKCDR